MPSPWHSSSSTNKLPALKGTSFSKPPINDDRGAIEFFLHGCREKCWPLTSRLAGGRKLQSWPTMKIVHLLLINWLLCLEKGEGLRAAILLILEKWNKMCVKLVRQRQTRGRQRRLKRRKLTLLTQRSLITPPPPLPYLHTTPPPHTLKTHKSFYTGWPRFFDSRCFYWNQAYQNETFKNSP